MFLDREVPDGLFHTVALVAMIFAGGVAGVTFAYMEEWSLADAHTILLGIYLWWLVWSMFDKERKRIRHDFKRRRAERNWEWQERVEARLDALEQK